MIRGLGQWAAAVAQVFTNEAHEERVLELEMQVHVYRVHVYRVHVYRVIEL